MPSSGIRRGKNRLTCRGARRQFFTPLRVEWLECRELLTALVSVNCTSTTVNEGDQASFTISGSYLPPGGVTVNYETTPGTATQGSDYTGLSGSVFLQPMMPTVTVNVSTLTDAVSDSGETFSLTLTGVTGDATIVTGSASMSIVEIGGPPPGPNPQYIVLNSPGTINEGQNFTLTGTVLPPGSYSLSGSINWGGFVTSMGSTVSFTTTSAGNFSIPNIYYDDGVSPGNGTASDIATIVLNVSVNGTQLSAQTTSTVQNVSPTGTFDLDFDGNYGFILNGLFSDPGLADVHSVTINWGDGSPVETFNSPQATSIIRSHQYPLSGQTYTTQITITDDDLGSWTWSGSPNQSLTTTNMLIERRMFDEPWDTVSSGEELSADEGHRWTNLANIPGGAEVTSIQWLRLPWSEWQAAPSYVSHPPQEWTVFAGTMGNLPSTGTPPVGDWAITAKVNFVGGFFVFATPQEEPVNLITETRWEAGHPNQQFYYTDLEYPESSIRVFPEKNTPSDAEAFNKVNGVVSLARPVAAGFKFTASMKVLDPDHRHDPENADDGFDPNDVFDTLIDIKANDNRQTAGGWGDVGVSPVTTTIEFLATQSSKTTVFTINDAQPGNNFILSSGHLNSAITKIGLSTVDGVTPLYEHEGHAHPLPPGNYTPILTVWRTLWIETDSMRAPNPTTEGPFDQPPVMVNGQMVEDPQFDRNSGDVPDPPLDLLIAEYQVANIEVKKVQPADDPTDGNADPATGDPGWFMHYLDRDPMTGGSPIATAKAQSMFDNRVYNDNVFWVGQLVGGYENFDTDDNDPNDTVTTFGMAMTGTSLAFVFFESSRDYVAYHLANPNPPTPCDELTMYQRVAFHESGHFFGLPDRDGTGEPRGIMNYKDAWNYLPAHHNWTDLGTIQSVQKPGVV